MMGRGTRSLDTSGAAADTRHVQRLKRATELLFLFVFFPLAVLLAIDIAIAVSLMGLFAYLGGLLAAWLLFAYVVPLATGIMTPDEIVAGIRSQRRHEFEGEPLPEDRLLWIPWKGGEDEPVPEDRALWVPGKPAESDSLFG
jgi:hypothetical protein